MTVLGRISAVTASELVDVGMGLHMRVEHRLVHACVGALLALERLGADVVAKVILLQERRWVFLSNSPGK